MMFELKRTNLTSHFEVANVSSFFTKTEVQSHFLSISKVRHPRLHERDRCTDGHRSFAHVGVLGVPELLSNPSNTIKILGFVFLFNCLLFQSSDLCDDLDRFACQYPILKPLRKLKTEDPLSSLTSGIRF